MNEIKKYDTVFRDSGYRSREASQGLRYVAKLCATYKFSSTLDVGCGPGWSVVEFLIRGKKAQGVESCEYLFKEELRVPAGLGAVKRASITEIPHPAETFDMVFCTDVLEHVPEQDVHKALSELIRVSKKYVFCSICSEEAICFPHLKLHCTVKPREWWEQQFAQFKLKKLHTGEGLEYMYVRVP
ncbi:MAG: class I SAM-dependent methyltransferase [Alphaproteobacteria bacterium]|nr:class I SAM-dependent methyltransferase [Alphaproteobacteria bacterium]